MSQKTKASRLLELLQSPLNKYLLPQVTIERANWISSPNLQMEKLRILGKVPFAVRSSSRFEDNDNQSNAGKFASFLNVQHGDLALAIDQVFNSYETQTIEDEVLIQPYIQFS